jgi:hypothetical protein
MKLPGVLVITTALAAALAASGPEVAVAGGGAHNGGIYPWYRYGYSVPYPYGLAPSATVHVVTGRSVATAPVPVLPYHLYCAYGYDYPFGCPYWPYWYW